MPKARVKRKYDAHLTYLPPGKVKIALKNGIPEKIATGRFWSYEQCWIGTTKAGTPRYVWRWYMLKKWKH